ncbi:MAG: hypothetical protein LBR08_01315 [Bacteroidales bacterium]|nr:hypothetical protein [Bacteroidales bacterium]
MHLPAPAFYSQSVSCSLFRLQTLPVCPRRFAGSASCLFSRPADGQSARADEGYFPRRSGFRPKNRRGRARPAPTDSKNAGKHTGDRNYLTRDETCLTGDETCLTGDETCLTGNEIHLTGDENRLTGDENRLTGNENRLTGNENRLTGNETRLTGDENRLTGVFFRPKHENK